MYRLRAKEFLSSYIANKEQRKSPGRLTIIIGDISYITFYLNKIMYSLLIVYNHG